MKQIYRLLLYLFPSSSRAEYGGEMYEVFRARQNETQGAIGRLALWIQVIPDLVLNALAVQWDVLRQDLRQAAKTLRYSPGFALAAVMISGIGMGATTAAFSIVNHVLLQPLPFPYQERLVKLREDDLSGLGRFWDVSPANYRDW